MHYEGDLVITKENANEFVWLTSVGGGLSVLAEFNAPTLTSVDGRLYVLSEFNAPNLTSVGHWLGVAAEFNAPNLTSVEGEHITKFAYLLGLDWPVLVTDGYIRVGCQRHTKERWSSFTNAQIAKMDTCALEFWAKNKQTILGM